MIGGWEGVGYIDDIYIIYRICTYIYIYLYFLDTVTCMCIHTQEHVFTEFK